MALPDQGIELGSSALQADSLTEWGKRKSNGNIIPRNLVNIYFLAASFRRIKSFAHKLFHFLPSVISTSKIPFYKIDRNRGEEGGTAGLRTAHGLHITIVVVFSFYALYDFFVTPRTVAHQAPLSKRFSKQEPWSGLLFLSPGDLPYPGIKPTSPVLVSRFFTTEPLGKPSHSVSQGLMLPGTLPSLFFEQGMSAHPNGTRLVVPRS